ncbi:uncharacterized protein CBL_14551 [Carabus blaptoides fortunei]
MYVADIRVLVVVSIFHAIAIDAQATSKLCSKNGILYPDPGSCSSYFQCENGHLKHVNCPRGQNYNCRIERCEFQIIPHCCSASKSTPTVTPLPTTLPVTTDTPTQVCKNGDKVANINDCNSYYECENNTPVKKKCRFNLVWNCWRRTCTLPIGNDHCCKKKNVNGKFSACPFIGVKSADPTNCGYYYECNVFSTVLKSCPNGKNFDVWAEECKPKEKAICMDGIEGQNSITPTVTVSTATPTPTKTPIKICNNGKKVVDVNDCNSYYQCESNAAVKKTCRFNFVWNCWVKMCTLPFGVNHCCKKRNVNGKFTACPVLGSKSPDPSNCRKYYECSVFGAVLKSCPNGKRFDVWSEKCKPEQEATCMDNIEEQNSSTRTEGPTATPSNSIESTTHSPFCPQEGTKIPNTADCKSYFECNKDGQLEKKPCPKGLVWNCFSKSCSLKIFSPCCKDDPHANDTETSYYCPINGISIPNPFTCNEYYQCDKHKIEEKQCNAGQRYSWLLFKCVKASQGECAPGTGNGSTSSPGETSSDSTTGPGGHGSDSTAGPGEHGSDSTTGPGDHGSDSTAGPGEHGSDSTAGPGEHGSDSTAGPGEHGSDSTPGPGEHGSDSTAGPGDHGSDSTAGPGEHGSDSTTGPGEHGSEATSNPSCTDTEITTDNSSTNAESTSSGEPSTESTTSTTGTTKPSNPLCSKNGIRYPASNDCYGYLECQNGGFVKRECSGGAVYNCEKKNCELQETPHCCSKNTPIKKHCPPKKAYSCWYGGCVHRELADCISDGSQDGKKCSKDGTKLGHPDDCGKYYECVDNKIVTKSCASGLEFNPWFLNCYEPKLAYCNKGTTINPTTPTIGTTSSLGEHSSASTTGSGEPNSSSTSSPSEPNSSSTSSPSEPNSSSTSSPSEPNSASTSSPSEPNSSSTSSPSEPNSSSTSSPSVNPTARLQVAQVNPTARLQVAQVNPTARLQVAQVNPTARLQVAQVNPTARLQVAQMNPTARLQVAQMNPTARLQVALNLQHLLRVQLNHQTHYVLKMVLDILLLMTATDILNVKMEDLSNENVLVAQCTTVKKRIVKFRRHHIVVQLLAQLLL